MGGPFVSHARLDAAHVALAPQRMHVSPAQHLIAITSGTDKAQERRQHNIINGSRRKRIARGSGTRVQDVNRLLKNYTKTDLI